MHRRMFILACVVLGISGCDLLIKNGLFACGQPSDCPSGYFCWSGDNRCYDAEEPPCEPKSCQQVVAEFESIGIAIECGSLPDGCDGSIECGACSEGTLCGANGQNFICGCEEITCAAARPGGAECGDVVARCGEPGQTISCGDCVGANEVCSENYECVCPPGADCNDGCSVDCVGDEVCVGGECCAPSFPCIENDCSPPGGLSNGCGAKAVCPPCTGSAECTLTGDLRYECIDDCTCEAQGFECGQPTICGNATPCGTCEANGFGEGYRCDSGQCVCDDPFEVNDSFDTPALLCGPELGGFNCVQEAWTVDVQASLHSEGDVDFYAVQTLDARTPIIVQTYDGESKARLLTTYLCPDGWTGMQGCSGWIETIKGIEFCVTDEDDIAIQRWCPSGGSSSLGTLLVGVEPTDFRGDCDAYGLKITATYAQEPPTF